MAGPVIENVSNRKLIIIIMCMILLEILFLYIGGIKAPQPTHHTGPAGMKACKQRKNPNEMVTPWNCEKATLVPSNVPDVTPDMVVFVGLFPPIHAFTITKWFQYLLCFANIHIKFSVHHQVRKDAIITMNFRLAYSDAELGLLQNNRNSSLWVDYASTKEENRPLSCNFNHSKTIEHHDYEYDCDTLFMFQLGSVPHKRYLLNVKLPTSFSDGSEANHGIGRVSDIDLIGIHQTGGFTKVWLIMKSVLSVLMVAPLVWFWRRVQQLNRKSMLIEKACFILGLSMIFLNIPFEFITIPFDATWMLLFTDVRQGLFYAVLFSFWVVFTGEHLMDQARRNKLSAYRWHLACIFLTSFALLSFDLAERGVQLSNPFGTVWSHPKFGYALLIVGALSTLLYLILLVYLVYKVFRSIRYKRRFILPEERAVRLRVIVFRLKLVMLLTLATAGLTVAFFFLEQKLEGVVNELSPVLIEISSAFFTGVYGMWNIYVCTILFMYAPSHKLYDLAPADDASEEHEMERLHPETEQSEIFQVARTKERED